MTMTKPQRTLLGTLLLLLAACSTGTITTTTTTGAGRDATGGLRRELFQHHSHNACGDKTARVEFSIVNEDDGTVGKGRYCHWAANHPEARCDLTAIHETTESNGEKKTITKPVRYFCPSSCGDCGDENEVLDVELSVVSSVVSADANNDVDIDIDDIACGSTASVAFRVVNEEDGTVSETDHYCNWAKVNPEHLCDLTAFHNDKKITKPVRYFCPEPCGDCGDDANEKSDDDDDDDDDYALEKTEANNDVDTVAFRIVNEDDGTVSERDHFCHWARANPKARCDLTAIHGDKKKSITEPVRYFCPESCDANNDVDIDVDDDNDDDDDDATQKPFSGPDDFLAYTSSSSSSSSSGGNNKKIYSSVLIAIVVVATAGIFVHFAVGFSVRRRGRYTKRNLAVGEQEEEEDAIVDTIDLYTAPLQHGYRDQQQSPRKALSSII